MGKTAQPTGRHSMTLSGIVWNTYRQKLHRYVQVTDSVENLILTMHTLPPNTNVSLTFNVLTFTMTIQGIFPNTIIYWSLVLNWANNQILIISHHGIFPLTFSGTAIL